MHCLVTGFDSFGEVKRNPSQLVVEALPNQLKTSNKQTIDLTRLVLTTCCQESWTAMQDAIAQMNKEPELIILTGVAPDRDRITLERFALNIADYRMADNQGHWLKDQVLDESGPDAIKCNLPLVELEHYLTGKGFLCDISNHAGSFLCNEIYYRCLNRWRKQAGIVFVHTPQTMSSPSGVLEENIDTASELDESIATGKHVSAIIEIIQFCSNRK